MKVVNLKCNGITEPNQIQYKKLLFGWNLISDENGAYQTAYRISVKRGQELVWDSGKVESTDCLYIPYEGEALTASTEYIWQVEAWDQNDQVSEPSLSSFETGLYEWKAKWIGYDEPVNSEVFDKSVPFYCADDFQSGENKFFLPPAPYLRKVVQIQKKVEKAKIYISAFGIVDVKINGKKITSHHFIPGLSNYEETVYSEAFDVTELAETGETVIGAVLADGWYAGYIGLNNREWYGSKPRVMIQLELSYRDGSLQTIISDETWKVSYGGLREADIMEGEKFDATMEPLKWEEKGFDDSHWKDAQVGAEHDIMPTPHPGVPIVEHEHIKPEHVSYIGESKVRVKFDKYICGVLKIRIKGEANSRIIIRHAETLDERGELHLIGNRSARCQDEYVLRGVASEEEFFPEFTYHGFRYADIDLVGKVSITHIEGVQISSQILDTSEFWANNKNANIVYRMVKATEKANLFDVPTDCTARDERLGWGMEGNHFLYAMTYMNNQYRMVTKWAKDIWDGQRENGALEAVAPTMMMKDIEQFVGDIQSNHGVYMVYALYKMYGDMYAVRKYFPQMLRYFDYLDRNSDRNLRFATSCDWLGIIEETDHSDLNHGYGECSPAVIGTAHYAITVQMMCEMCDAVGDLKEAKKFKKLHEEIIKVFRQNFVERDGTLRYKKQGEYLMALACGGFPDESAQAAVDFLEAKLMKDGYIRWFGGTPTTPYLLQTLKRYGKGYLANRFIVSDRYPSIGYMHSKGYDTIWERWDGIWEDGRIHPQVMNALCHEGYAVTGAYLINGLAGIGADAPGYKKIEICPEVSKEITECKGKFYSPYGEITTKWAWRDEVFTIEIQIPVNTTATITLPCTKTGSLETEKGTIHSSEYKNGKVIIKTGSGTYAFTTHTTIH